MAAWLDVETGFDEQIFFTDFGKSAMSAAQEMPTSEALAREQIDAMLVACRWVVQNFSALNLGIGQGIALRGRPAVARAREKHHDYEILETPSGIAFHRHLP